MLGQGLDNWACVDNFCAYIAGIAWLHGRIPDAVVERWAVSPDLWWRRVAVVCTVALNNKSRGGAGDTARTLRICQTVLGDPEIMVQKAISWALRMLVPWDRCAVEDFLERNRDEVSKLVLREVTRKLRTGKKN